jgi:uncharacterized membrane protein
MKQYPFASVLNLLKKPSKYMIWSPFVPAVAGALKNKQVIISGLTVGVLGFAIGNYLGILLAWWLE